MIATRNSVLRAQLGNKEFLAMRQLKRLVTKEEGREKAHEVVTKAYRRRVAKAMAPIRKRAAEELARERNRRATRNLDRAAA